MGLTDVAARLVEPARWIVIGGIALTLANTVLFFVASEDGEGASDGAAPGAASSAVRTPDRRPTVSISAILSRNLFGEAGAVDTATTRNDLPAVETRLPLELQGVFQADLAEESAAIVAQKGKAGELYTVGQTLPGNATLIEVHADHVVLRRAGVRETLRFPQLIGNGNRLTPMEDPDTAANDPEAAPWTKDAPSPRDFVSSYREKIDEDPQAALEEMGISPVSEDGADGYRLDAVAADSPYLSQTGLQPGDVVLSVNGQPVGNIQQDRRQIDNILAQGSARIEVQRGTRRFFITASLNR
jgi:general secretion pathway protein C